MTRRSQAHNLKLVTFADTRTLYDTNRVKTYACSEAEAMLIEQGLSGRPDLESRSPLYDERAIAEARERLQRLSDLSTSLGAGQGLAPDYTGHPTYLLLHLCDACNLQCTYCYAEACDANDAPRRMSEATARANIDGLFRHAEAGQNCTIVFAGGEPLLNFKVLAAASGYARERSRQRGVALALRVLTNGTVMRPEILRLISDHGISLQISLDGPPEIQDRLRPTRSGQGSAGKVMETIAYLDRPGCKDYRIRSTVCHHNADLARIVEYFQKQGVKNFTLCPVQSAGKTSHALRKSDLDRISAYYHQMCAATIAQMEAGTRADIPEAFALYVHQLELGLKTKRYCGAGRDMRVVAPDGQHFPCPVFIGDVRYGTGSTDGCDQGAPTIAFPNRSVDTKKVCRRCWARNLCGGGCVAQALRLNGDPERPDPLECALTRARVKGAIAIHQHRKASMHR